MNAVKVARNHQLCGGINSVRMFEIHVCRWLLIAEAADYDH